MKYTLNFTIIALTLGLASLSIASISPAFSQVAAIEAATESQTVNFAIEKMTCAMCPITVRKAMEQVSGVEEVKVNFDNKTATVIFNPALATTEAIAAASANAGYPAQIVEKNQ